MTRLPNDRGLGWALGEGALAVPIKGLGKGFGFGFGGQSEGSQAAWGVIDGVSHDTGPSTAPGQGEPSTLTPAPARPCPARRRPPLPPILRPCPSIIPDWAEGALRPAPDRHLPPLRPVAPGPSTAPAGATSACTHRRLRIAILPGLSLCSSLDQQPPPPPMGFACSNITLLNSKRAPEILKHLTPSTKFPPIRYRGVVSPDRGHPPPPPLPQAPRN